LPIDDLDSFLLDIVSAGILRLSAFDKFNLGECLNRRIPVHTRPELTTALFGLFEASDIEAVLELSCGRRLERAALRLLDRHTHWLDLDSGPRVD